MPVYEFRCPTCNIDLEIACSLKDHGTETCPHCGTRELIRAFRTAPYICTVGCPSGDFKRKANNDELERITNKKFDERNRDEIAAAPWRVLDDKEVERIDESTRAVGLSEAAGFKPSPSVAGI